MTLMKHELRQGRTSLIVWTAAIGFLMAICIFLFPEMKGEMDAVSGMFASMGSFSAAFGMDRLNFGTLTGFYAVECGNILGLGGAFFASLVAVTVLAKEEKEGTAEFLLTHPVSRRRVITEKLCAVLAQIVVLNAVILALALGSVAAIGEAIPWKELLLLHLAYFLLQVELAGICFGISAFLRQGSLGIGLGVAAVMYFLNIIANISDSAQCLKYITPFGYAEGADIVTNGSLDVPLVLLGILYGIIGIAAAYVRYCKKDIR
ncbi:MAG: ABC transporter permease subunit [Oscillospiraceae bacterium]